MNFQEAKQLAIEKKDYIGKTFQNYRVKSIIPLPEQVDLKDLTVFIRMYLATNDIDMAAKVAQLEDYDFSLGVISDTEWNNEVTPYFGRFDAHFPL